jgi:L-amino acid N-acyltransferase YncA
MRLGYLVNIDNKHFYDGSLHPDGIRGMVLPLLEEPISFLDFSDQENAAHSHETAAGYIYNWNERLEREKRESEQLRKKAIAQLRAADMCEPKPNPNMPKANIYLRPVETKDIPGVLAMLNWYIENTVRCVDLDRLSFQDMRDRVDECEREKLPFLVAAEGKVGFGHAMNNENEKILGYAMACDFTGPRTANRFTAELELFVHPRKHRLGIGRCLLDKILEICDPSYIPKHGYFFDCAPDKRPLYCSGGNRSLARLIFIVHYPADDDCEYKWIRNWLERDYAFEEQALLKGTGVKMRNLQVPIDTWPVLSTLSC